METDNNIEIEENTFKIVRRSDYWSSDNTYHKANIEIDSSASLSQVLHAFECFLKACGYYPPDNTILDFVEE